jgi:YesN/AraC family two-component response regulator
MSVLHEKIEANYTIRLSQTKSIAYDHWHGRAEFVFIIKGSCKIKVGKQEYSCSAGDLVFIHSGEIHSIECDEHCEKYVCTFDAAMLLYFHSKICFVQSYISLKEQKKAGVAEEIARTFEEIFTEKVLEKPMHDSLIRADIIRIYSILARYFKSEQKASLQNVSQFERFQNALTFIAQKYDENITLADIANLLHYNPAYVSNLFVTYAGVNFKNYLDTFRVGKAIELIRDTDFKLTKIATMCGYENVRTFNNVFKRITGKAPSELRK